MQTLCLRNRLIVDLFFPMCFFWSSPQPPSDTYSPVSLHFGALFCVLNRIHIYQIRFQNTLLCIAMITHKREVKNQNIKYFQRFHCQLKVAFCSHTVIQTWASQEMLLTSLGLLFHNGCFEFQLDYTKRLQKFITYEKCLRDFI